MNITRDFPIPYPWYQEGNGCTIDVNSAVRNSMSAAAKANTVVTGLAVGGGAMAAVQGGLIVRRSIRIGMKAYKDGDMRGAVHAAMLGTVGASYLVVGANMVTNGVGTLTGNTAAAAAGATAISAAGFAMYGAVLGYGLYGLKETAAFRSEFQSKEGPSGQWEWLEQNLKNADQKEWSQFERQVGRDAADALRYHFTRGIKTQAEVLEAIDKGSFKEQVKYVLFIIIGLLGIAAFTAGLLCPISSAIMFAIGGVLWLALDNTWIHEKVAEKCWAVYNWAQKAPVEPKAPVDPDAYQRLS